LRHDGKDPFWFHHHCFFDIHRLKSADEIENFENIKYGDQVDVLTKIDATLVQKLKKVKQASEEKPNETDPLSYAVKYSSSSEDFCTFCDELIDRNEIRIKKIAFNTEVGIKFDKEIFWHHLHCFVFQRDVYGIKFGGDELPGFERLQMDHQQFILEAMP
jgi:poly [ADP-ribose] polymerase 1